MITPYKGRKIDLDYPVQVYRNLNARSHEMDWSIRQKGLVVAHAWRVCISSPKFNVSLFGKRRATAAGVRNVHAFCVGFIRPFEEPDFNVVKSILYDFKVDDSFIYWDKDQDTGKFAKFPVFAADMAYFYEGGCRALNTC